MGKYKAYPEYRDSGVEWLDVVPKHWSTTQVKYGYDVTLGKMLQREKGHGSEVLKPYLKAQNIQPNGISLREVGTMWFSPAERSRLRLKNNDVLVSEGGDVGRAAVWREELPECYIQNAINRVRSSKNSMSYFFYWIGFLKNTNYINILCNKATIAHYTAEKLKESPLLLPGVEEQAQIAKFLDHETAKIDTLISKQERLIELLQEKRQAVISHAVTKGLDASVPLKDSGVEWIQGMPTDWNVQALKYLCSYNDDTLSENTAKDFEIEYVDIGSVSAIEGIKATDLMRFGEAPSRARRRVKDGDIIISTVRTYLEAIAPIQAPPENLIVSTGFAVIRPRSALYPGYAAYCLRARGFIEEVVARSVGVSYPAINASELISIYVPAPPIEEQEQIAGFLKKESSKIDTLVKKAEEVIELMEERRTALISAAVTGKIDVRDIELQ